MASPPSCSTSSTSARSTPISAWRLARDVQQGLREDLRLLVMSATIDGARVASLLGDAPVIAAEGRAFPVETRYLGRDARPIEPQIADAIVRAMRADTGSLLAFLPGAGEIRRTKALLDGRFDPSVDVVALYGALAADEQDRAIAPAAPGRRKIVLATSIAETSITIEGVRIVIDSGLARVPRYEPDVGVTRLETVRVSRAAADQRRGRAGRTEPGICYRLWDEPQTAALEPFSRPEILSADLSSLALDLAAWGSGPENLAFLDPPPRPALAEAKALLAELGAIDGDGRITEEGQKLRRLPLPPRLARMVVDAAAEGAALPAAEIAVLIGERGLAGDDVDLTHRLARVPPRPLTPRARGPRAGAALGGDCEPHRQPLPQPQGGEEMSVGALLALAYPERIAKNRGGAAGAFVLANGRGAQVDPASPLAREPYLAVAELAGSAAAGRILLGAPIALAEIEARFADRIVTREDIAFDPASASLRLRRLRRFGAITLSEQPMPAAASEAAARILAEGIARLGIDRLPWTKALRQWRDRVMFLRASEGDEWPDLSDAALAATVNAWLGPSLAAKTALRDITADELEHGLERAAAVAAATPARGGSADPFRSAHGLARADRLSGGGRAEDRDPRAGAVRPRPPSGDCRRQDPVADRASFAGASAGADDARPARLLARQLRRGARRDARPLSEAPLAGRSARRAGNPARQAAKGLAASYVRGLAPSGRGSRRDRPSHSRPLPPRAR